MDKNFLNKNCIFRGDKSGVFFGTLVARKGQEVEIKNCRRLWYWAGACSLSEIAKIGTAAPEKCKFSVSVDTLIITDCIEIILCTDVAVKVIEGVKEWKKR